MSSASNSSRIASSASGPFSPVQRLHRRTPDHRHVVARELVLRQQLAHLHLDQVQQLRVVDHVALVQEHHDVGNAHLARQQDVLARLRHRTVDRRHHQDGAVHLRRTRDHVLHVVGMARAVDVRVVPLVRRILHVARRNRQDLRRIAPALALGRLRHLVVGHHRLRPALVRRHLRQRRRQRRLAVINMTDRANVAVRLVPLEFRLGHGSFLTRLISLSLGLRRATVALGSRADADGLERVKGIEPSSSAWKAVALPLSYTRACRSGSRGPDSRRPHTYRGGGQSGSTMMTRRLYGAAVCEPQGPGAPVRAARRDASR